jgi:hypothetical protein
MSIKIRNEYPIDPQSPTIEVSTGSGKNRSVTVIRPQESKPIAEGDVTIAVVPPAEEEAAN